MLTQTFSEEFMEFDQNHPLGTFPIRDAVLCLWYLSALYVYSLNSLYPLSVFSILSLCSLYSLFLLSPSPCSLSFNSQLSLFLWSHSTLYLLNLSALSLASLSAWLTACCLPALPPGRSLIERHWSLMKCWNHANSSIWLTGGRWEERRKKASEWRRRRGEGKREWRKRGVSVGDWRCLQRHWGSL